MPEKGPLQSLSGFAFFNELLPALGDRAIREALRRVRRVAMDRVACHDVGRTEGGEGMVVRVRHKRQTEERMGTGIILPDRRVDKE